MPFVRDPPSRLPPRSIAASLRLHLALLGALALLPSIEQFQPAPEEGVEVELVTPEQIEPKPELQAAQPTPPPTNIAQPETPPAESQTPARPNPPTPPPVPAAPVMVRARRLLSDDVLANPRSRGTREALGQLEDTERIEQLCNLEAMGQVHAWKAEFQPDRVVAYAMEGTKLSRTAMRADGAVFRSKQQWYRIKFKCELSPDRRKVAGFEFMVGDPVPRREWAALDLPAVH
jgi:hypothetical protein